MDFWRSGRARSVRTQQALPGGKKPGIMHSIRHMYFPPWVPVAVIIVAVFGILGLLFATRSATGSPRISDHWHASYTYYKCGNKMPNAPTWEGVGVHTHGDGIFHIHPFQPGEEGAGARMVKWFEYGGGELSQDTIRLPGESPENTVSNGDICPEGTPEEGVEGVLQVFVNGAKLDSWSRYIPHDGDQVKLIFGEADSLVQLDDRQVIDVAPTRTIDIDITGDSSTSTFSPSAPEIDVGEVVQFNVHNKSTGSQEFRVPNGVDPGDDFVAVPDGSLADDPLAKTILEPGANGFVVVRFDEPGQYAFENKLSERPAAGTLIVVGAGETSSPTPGPGAEAEVSGAMTLADDGYEPASLTLAGAAGKTFGITLTNTGKFVHNLQIAGPDGDFGTEDDITSLDVPPLGPTPPASPTPTPAPTTAAPSDAGSGSPTAVPTPVPTAVPVNTTVITGELPAGTYKYRDEFHPEITGTIVITA
jgi:plastocyanin